MSATVKVVPKEDWEIVKKYVNSGKFNSGVVLIPEDVLNELPRETKDAIENLNGYSVDYDFGGECDVSLDVVLSPHHHLITCLLEEDVANDDVD